MINFDEIREKRKELKSTIWASIAEFMKKHNCKELDVTDFDSTPIILEDLERYDYSYTLDRITYDGFVNVRVHCSNCEDNDSFFITTLGTDTLIDLYEWLLDNEEFMDFGEE